MSDMEFLKGSRDQFEKLRPDCTWEDKAEIIRRQMAEVYGAKNLSFLLGSGCSSLMKGSEELGIPTMRFLAEEFQTLLETEAENDGGTSFVCSKKKAELKDKLGIDLSASDVSNNLEKMMATHQRESINN